MIYLIDVPGLISTEDDHVVYIVLFFNCGQTSKQGILVENIGSIPE